MDLAHAVVIVTGASSGIGAATAVAASRAGARVVLLARREDQVLALADGLPGAVGIGCDVTSVEDVTAAVRAVLERFGRIDVLVNNAGQSLNAGIDGTDLEQFRAILEINLIAPLAFLQAVLPTMRAQRAGSIVNVSSGTTLRPYAGTSAYSASKAALNQLSAVAREELTGTGVVVSTVLPSLTRTDLLRNALGSEPGDDSFDGADTPEHVAAVILEVIRSGVATTDLVPVEYGGTYIRPAE